MRLTGQPLPIGALASAQLGVPVAAATVGSQLHLLEPGEPAALILGALVTIAVASLSGGLAVRAGLVTAASPGGQLDQRVGVLGKCTRCTHPDCVVPEPAAAAAAQARGRTR
jgi:hypothetical protein